MHTAIQKTFEKRGYPLAASMAPVRANGSAKTECFHVIISKVVAILDHNFINDAPT